VPWSGFGQDLAAVLVHTNCSQRSFQPSISGSMAAMRSCPPGCGEGLLEGGVCLRRAYEAAVSGSPVRGGSSCLVCDTAGFDGAGRRGWRRGGPRVGGREYAALVPHDVIEASRTGCKRGRPTGTGERRLTERKSRRARRGRVHPGVTPFKPFADLGFAAYRSGLEDKLLGQITIARLPGFSALADTTDSRKAHSTAGGPSVWTGLRGCAVGRQRLLSRPL